MTLNLRLQADTADGIFWLDRPLDPFFAAASQERLVILRRVKKMRQRRARCANDDHRFVMYFVESIF